MIDNYTSEDPIDYMFSILYQVSQNSTQWSLVSDAGNLVVYFKTVTNREWRFVSLRDFNFSCHPEVGMLDVKEEGSGNIRNQYLPYTQELNAKLIRSTYRQLESRFGPFTEDLIRKIFTYPETTEYDP